MDDFLLVILFGSGLVKKLLFSSVVLVMWWGKLEYYWCFKLKVFYYV